MIFRRKADHKLPKFPDNVEAVFYELCEDLPTEALPDIKEELDIAVKNILSDSIENARIETKLVNELYDVSCALLERYANLEEEARSLVIGAIRYFVMDNDPLPDSGFASGFYDDVKVMNFVLNKIGENDLIIDV